MIDETEGTPELLRLDEDNGLVAIRDAESVATVLIRALTDTQWRVRVTQRTRQRLESEFTWERTARKILSIASNDRDGQK